MLISYSLGSRYEYTIEFDEKQLFYLVLPPIIFSAGYNMKKRKFFKFFKYITAYGVIGTCLNFITMACFLMLFNNLRLFELNYSSE